MQQSSEKLNRKLGLFDLFSIASGAMISSGLFVLPGIAFYLAGPGMLLSYLIASLLLIPTLLSKAELSTAMPRSGGNYFFIQRSLGPLMGTIAGLLDWLSISLKTAFALIGIGGIFIFFFPEFGQTGLKFAAVTFTLGFTALNLLSVKGTGIFQIMLVVSLIIILLVVITLGFPAVDVNRFKPFTPKGWTGVFAVAGMVFVSYGGLTKVTAVAGEVKNPSRNIPLSMFLAFGIISTLYLLIIYVTIGNVPGNELSNSLTPITLGAKYSMGFVGKIVVTIGAFLAFASTGNAGIMAASRSPMAMSRDGLIPRWFSKTSKKFDTPYLAILFTSLFITMTVSFLSLEVLVKTASAMMILMFALVNLAAIIMRTSLIESYRPVFKTPLFPVLQVAAIILYGFLIFEMGTAPLLFTGGFIVFALLWYLFYVQKRIDNESALVYLVERITSHHLERAHIENELRSISLERDSVEFDRFDKLIEEAIILDLKESVNARKLFRKFAEKLAERLDEDKEKIFNLFMEREKESSTVMSPGLAVPHIIVEGKNRFEIVMVRSKEGVMFSELHPKVHTMFALVGSPDERNFHLRALMNIAHIVQEENFQKRWHEAQNKEQLRDVVLLSSRERK
ncbi:MAG: amino acid permease [Deltaproteobacteria bacterium]|jgi:APA family basic amino acid/polyamine antiporter|nr:amino acid permease [Deltaproteobacteria bacterium]